ncbi:DUF4194 domain-containing protein [Actinomadura rugatobispora]|uniref:DUF4194 domain-containing protein n=1 Tax=Actinomadura rugatobispora TaxID=1994 RepID=A0ABW1ADI1_9ACTN|nr:DUF4194 domain-containing protein [Actinomadura rugatobispora]
MTGPPDPSFAAIFDEEALTGPHTPGRTASAVISEDTLAKVFEEDDDRTAGTLVEGPARPPRFDGDTGELPAEACWALQALVAAPHVSEQSRKAWAAVVQYADQLRVRLSELGLVLEINREHGYAFTRQGGDPSPHGRAILRTKTLSLAASALCLYLYNQYVLAPDAPVVETTDMVDHMLAYRRKNDTDDAAFDKKTRTAIKTLEDAAIIKPIKGTGRYVIYGVITSILTAERVEALSDRYRAIADGTLQHADEGDTAGVDERGERKDVEDDGSAEGERGGTADV